MSSPTQLQGDEAPPVPAPAGAAKPLGPDLTGEVLVERYRVLDKLGAGGMGTVYVAEHTTIGKKFAIKVLGTEFATRADLVERFLREARAASMISQQNVVEITDFGETPDGSPFFVMEYLAGEDLRDLVEREGQLPWPRVRHLMVQICRALEAAHAEGIIHRDMKPDNCFRITRGKDEDFVKVLDFGIAKIEGGGEAGQGLTQTGMLFGTPEYMSPEQAQGARVDHRVDIYALGVIMYQLLTGQRPFTGETFMAVLTKHMFETPVAPSEVAPEANISAEVEAIVLKAMQKDPAYRFQSMTEMIAAIEAVGTGAGAVAVVAEELARPAGGPTAFATQSGSMHRREETVPDFAAAQAAVEAQEPRRRTGLWVGLGGMLAAAAVVGYMLLGNEGQAEPLPELVEVEVQTPAVDPVGGPAAVEAAGPAPTEAPEPALAARSTLSFDTNVPADILDARDRAIYGSTGAEGGVEFPQSDEPMRLLLAAEGYAELEIEVVPDREAKRYAFELEPLADETKGRRGGRRGGGKAKATSEDAAAADMPKAAGPKIPTKGGSDGEIKNPFEN